MQAESPFSLPIPDRKPRSSLQPAPLVDTSAMSTRNCHLFHLHTRECTQLIHGLYTGLIL